MYPSCILYAEMPRKLRFYQPKNHERKGSNERDKTMSLQVSIPLSVVMVFTVSFHLINVPKPVLSLPLSANLTAT